MALACIIIIDKDKWMDMENFLDTTLHCKEEASPAFDLLRILEVQKFLESLGK